MIISQKAYLNGIRTATKRFTSVQNAIINFSTIVTISLTVKMATSGWGSMVQLIITDKSRGGYDNVNNDNDNDDDGGGWSCWWWWW